jgi:hypothetical protein
VIQWKAVGEGENKVIFPELGKSLIPRRRALRTAEVERFRTTAMARTRDETLRLAVDIGQAWLEGRQAYTRAWGLWKRVPGLA